MNLAHGLYIYCASKKEGTYKCNTTTSAHLLYVYATRRGDFNAWRGNSIYTQLLSCCDGLFDQWNLRAPTIQAPILSLIKKTRSSSYIICNYCNMTKWCIKHIKACKSYLKNILLDKYGKTSLIYFKPFDACKIQ